MCKLQRERFSYRTENSSEYIAMLLIKAKGGLGNRMLSAATAIAYAKATEREWAIDWCDGLYAPLETNAVVRLFPELSRHAFEFVQCQKGAAITPLLWQGRLDWSVNEVMSNDFPEHHSNPLIYRRLSAPISENPSANQASHNEGILDAANDVEIFWSYTSKFGRIKRYLSAPVRKRGRDQVLGDVLRSYFMPHQEVVQTVDDLLNERCELTLGVHIRYTDLKVPIEKLMQCVQKQMNRHHYRYVYLASDSLSAQTQFQARFDNVITHEKRYNSDNSRLHAASDSEQVQEDANAALVDMLALSRCEGLVYCSRSTFAETSRLIGDIDKRKTVDVDRFNPKIRVKRVLQEYL